MPTKSTLKIIIIGEGGSGKSSLIRQYLKREYLSDYKPTVGTCFETRDIQQEDRLISIQLWDTAGQEVNILSYSFNSFKRGIVPLQFHFIAAQLEHS